MTQASNNSDFDFYDAWQGGANINDNANPALAINANINFDTVLTPNNTDISFGLEPIDGDIVISPRPFDASIFGVSSAFNASYFLEPRGIYSAGVVAQPTIINAQRFLNIRGFDALSLGRASIVNYNKEVAPKGWASSSYGYQYAYNLTQYRSIKGYDASLYGKPYVQGGVKYLATRGVDTSAYGKTVVINTTANRDIKPGGINSLVIAKPNVSPRIIYPVGLYQLNVGTHHIYDPAIKPLGVAHTTYGEATVWYHTRPVQPAGLLSLNTGYPVVYDPTQEIQAISLITSAIFGDTALKNTTAFINASGIDDLVVTPWAVVTNSNRYYAPNGIDSQAFGDNSIRNKTPSIFVDSIKPHGIGDAAIGYAIRKIGATGFDRLLLGKPLLTKTPELLPKTFISSRVSNLAFISHSIRYLLPVGHNSNEHGEHTLWFRYRYVEPQSWQSSKFGQASLTHGVRELIASGFIRQGYGNAWVSYGTRQLAPIGINKIHPTRHLVGGTRHLNPVGYVATLFGTRIIPENQYAYPQGFAGTFGLNNVRLDTQHLKPLGYISVGQQPADRWGRVDVYNLTQYIQQSQNFDRDNGLIPPQWSEWTAIENRNKKITSSGLLSLRFGYSKIDNNAAPILPLGIAPPVSTRYDVSLIAHGVRYINPDGLDAPAVSSWLATYNDARVVAAQGFNDTGLGLAAVKNTRRYYSGVGRFESSEYGEPMISHAIRYISLEPRYAIMPPQINLPAIDVWTKYATFRGFETAAYGTPSLDIRFNIIAPKWVYRYNMGDPYVKNLTPELGLYGHDSNEFGISSVRTQWRKVYADGDTLTLFGLAKIADTKQFIGLRGWQDMTASQKHTVIRTGAPPYSEQKISLDGGYDFEKDEAIAGYGIYFDERRLGVRIPKPGLNQNVIYTEGYEATLFGDGRVWSNNIQMLAGIAIHNISSNTVVYNKTRRIVLGEDDAIKSKIEVGNPRLSPWTIYAVVDAPEQARKNHTSIHSHYVNSDYGNRRPGVVIGRPKVESTIRSIQPRWSVQSRVGEPRLDLTRRIIAPRSFGVTKVGQPSIPFTDQTVVAYHDKKEPSSILGNPDIVIADRGDKTISVTGFNSQLFTKPDIQLYVRNLYHIGKDSLLMGASKQNDKPYMWQGLRVGAHVPTSIGAGDTSLFGDGMVSLRIRELTLDGWESFISEYDTANFNDRMKVSRPRTPPPQSQRITIDGFVATDYSNADIKFGQYFIRPDGNSDQFRKGGYHA